jgi:hypothetical protein
MKKILIFILTFYSILSCIGQINNWDKVCKNDTIIANKDLDKSCIYVKTNCHRPSKFGFRFDLGASYFNTNAQVQDWIGKPIHLSLGFTLSYNKWNFGIRTNTMTVTTKKQLYLYGATITENTKINPNRFDGLLSYTLNLKHNFSIEPYAGVGLYNFVQTEKNGNIEKQTTIKGEECGIMGVNIQKYFNRKNYNFSSVFLNLGYATFNNIPLVQQTDNGYFMVSLGVSYKFYPKKEVNSKD